MKYEYSDLDCNQQTLVRVLIRLFGAQKWYETLIKKPKKVIDAIINNYENDYSKQTYLSRIVSLLNCLKKTDTDIKQNVMNEYNKASNIWNNKTRAQRDSGVKTERQKKNWLTWKEIEKIRHQAEREAGSASDFQNYLIIALYTYIPPVRLDYGNMRVLKNENQIKDKTKNYLIFNAKNPKFVFYEYKTAKKYKKNEIEIPKKLYEIIKEWFEDWNHEKKWLLINVLTGEPIKSRNLGQKLARVFEYYSGKRIGVNQLRHIFLTEVVPKLYDQGNPEERKKLARMMGHSVEVQGEYIRKDVKPKKKIKNEAEALMKYVETEDE